MIALLAIVLLVVVIVCWAPFARYRHARGAQRDVTWAHAHHVLLLLLAAAIITGALLPEEIFRRYPDQFDPKSTALIGGVLAFIPMALFTLALELTVTFVRGTGLRRGLIAVLWALSAVLLTWLASPYLAT